MNKLRRLSLLLSTVVLCFAFALTSCKSTSSIIRKAAESAIKLRSNPTDKNIRDFRDKYAKATERINKMDIDAQVDIVNYIQLSNNAEAISMLDKAMQLFDDGTGSVTVSGRRESFTFQPANYTDLLQRTATGAREAYLVQGDRIMSSSNPSASQLETAMRDYERGGDQVAAADARRAMITRLLADGDEGFRQGQTCYAYERALNSYEKAIEYGSEEARYRYDNLLRTIGMTLAINVSDISEVNLNSLLNHLPKYFTAFVEGDMRRSLANIRADFALVMEVVDHRGTYRTGNGPRNDYKLELVLLDLRRNRNGVVIGTWPVLVTYNNSMDSRRRAQAEITAFGNTVYRNSMSICTMLKDVRVVHRK